MVVDRLAAVRRAQHAREVYLRKLEMRRLKARITKKRRQLAVEKNRSIRRLQTQPATAIDVLRGQSPVLGRVFEPTQPITRGTTITTARARARQKPSTLHETRGTTITTARARARQKPSTLHETRGDKILRLRWKLKSTMQKLRGQELSSSFVSELDYNTETSDAIVKLGSRRYRYFNVPEAIFISWTKGAATCMTSDDRKHKRWWLAKEPSLGAFFNHYIKYKYSWIELS